MAQQNVVNDHKPHCWHSKCLTASALPAVPVVTALYIDCGIYFISTLLDSFTVCSEGVSPFTLLHFYQWQNWRQTEATSVSVSLNTLRDVSARLWVRLPCLIWSHCLITSPCYSCTDITGSKVSITQIHTLWSLNNLEFFTFPFL